MTSIVKLGVAGIFACALSCTPQKDAATAQAIVNTVQCVSNEMQQVPEPSPEAIALTCGFQEVSDVVHIVEAEHALLAHKRALHACPASSSSPSSPPSSP
jgi:hypothetical protein